MRPMRFSVLLTQGTLKTKYLKVKEAFEPNQLGMNYDQKKF